MNHLNVLVVDDNEINLLLANKILANLDITVTSARNGVEAIEKVKSEKFDMILMDLHMPEIDGYEATKTIRELGYSGKIIAVTASVTISDKDVKDLGMDGHLDKPFSMDKIKSLISDFF